MEKSESEKLHVAVFGTKPDHEDGLVGIVSTINRAMYGTKQEPGGLVDDMCEVTTKVASHEITLYGTKDNPGGIASDMRSLKKTAFIGTVFVGACAVLLVVIEFITKIVPAVQHMK